MPGSKQFERELTRLGLSAKEAAVYSALLERGSASPTEIAKATGLNRTTCYVIFKKLEGLGLVSRPADKKKIVFELEHPNKISELIGGEKESVFEKERALADLLPEIVSRYNLNRGKPGVRFFEGKDGITEAIFDSLTTKDVIYSYIDNEAVNAYAADINAAYVKKRAKLGIKKKMLTLDRPYIHAHAKSFNPAITEVRVIPGESLFYTAVQIYDNKVSYVTLREGKMIGVIIEDPDISLMHKMLFEYMWERATPIPVGVPR